MFEKLTRVAERAATEVSRREFLGRLGRAAAAAAGALAMSGAASAGGLGKACAANSPPICRGKLEGAFCTMGRGRPGRCVAAPICYCRGF